MEKQKAIAILKELLEQTNNLNNYDADSADFIEWERNCRVAINNVFSNTPHYEKEFISISYYPSSFPSTAELYRRAYKNGLNSARGQLKSMISEVEQFWPDEKDDKLIVDQIQKRPENREIDEKKVFVIHGRNLDLKNAMFEFLRSLTLFPIEWNQAIKATSKGSPSIIEIIDSGMGMAQVMLILLTRDDEAKLRDKFVDPHDPVYDKELTPQARQNVIFEAGMAMGRYPDRTVLTQVGYLRPWSDVSGIHITHMDGSSERRRELVTKLENAGCKPDISGTDWLTSGNFGK